MLQSLGITKEKRKHERDEALPLSLHECGRLCRAAWAIVFPTTASSSTGRRREKIKRAKAVYVKSVSFSFAYLPSCFVFASRCFCLLMISKRPKKEFPKEVPSPNPGGEDTTQKRPRRWERIKRNELFELNVAHQIQVNIFKKQKQKDK